MEKHKSRKEDASSVRNAVPKGWRGASEPERGGRAARGQRALRSLRVVSKDVNEGAKGNKAINQRYKIRGQSCGEKTKTTESDLLSGRWAAEEQGSEGWKGPRRLKRKILSFCVLRLNCNADREVLEY